MESDRAGTVDLPYPSAFHAVQAPVLINYAAMLGGAARPDFGRPFVYGDLGCGDGFTLIVLAAAYPHCRFIGIDINHAAIERGRALIAAAALTNIDLIAGDLSGWRGFDLPVFDYIALHGVYSWVSDTTRDAIDAVLHARLAPDGLVYLGYNTEPGWAMMAPIRHFLRDFAGSLAEGMAALQALRAADAGFFQANPLAGMMLEDLARKDLRYVAHEVATPHWAPQSFARVADRMAALGLDYLGSTDLAENEAAGRVPAPFQAMVRAAPNLRQREWLCDMIVNRFFRRDVFGRARRRDDSADGMASILFGSPVPIAELASIGDVEADLVARLGGGTLAAGQYWSDLRRLSAGHQIAPFAAPMVVPERPLDDWRVPLALNRALLAAPPMAEPYALLASIPAGTGIAVRFDDALILAAIDAAGPAEAAAWAEASPRRGALRDRAFGEHWAAMIPDRLRQYQALGLIAPR